jgi:exopolysaccharide biosynthesis polyprenyl glycosylphosphotransferase
LRSADTGIAALVFLIALSASGALTSGVSLSDDPNAVARLLALGLVAALSWPLVFDALGLYRSQRRLGISQIVVRLLVAGTFCTVILGVGQLVLQPAMSGAFVAVCGVAQTLSIGALHLVIFATLRSMRRVGRNYRNVLVFGSGPRAQGIAELIGRHPEWGIRVLAFVDDGDVPVAAGLMGRRTEKLIDTPRLIREEVIDEVIVAVPRGLLATLGPAVALCAEAGIPVTVLSDLFGDYFPVPRVAPLGGQPALSFSVVQHSSTALAIKRGFDIVAASVLLVLLAPVMLAVAAAIRWDSKGPTLFRQQRSGLYGRRFQMLKFRTMCADAEALRVELLHLNEMDGPVFKVKDDPRITGVGRFLRRTSLDELPQLWHVLKGEMSLVGQRPPIPAEVEQYATFERRRLSMRPGLTCLWQVMGRNQINFADWVKLDLEYIDNWSLAADLAILLRTLPAVLRGTGS